MDVLAYSALNHQARLNKCISDKEVELCQKKRATEACWERAKEICMARCWTTEAEWKLQRCPSLTEYWKLIPSLPAGSQGFKVCNDSCIFSCGKCCYFTVPNGVSRLQIQIWGSGGMSTAGCCCGGSPYGSTGAYASVIFDVSPGWNYTLCAGCAYCCFAGSTSGANRVAGGVSWASGCKLRGFCADGGMGSMAEWMAQFRGYGGPSRMCQLGSCWNTAANFCNCGANYCSYNRGESGIIPFLPGANYHGSVQGGIVYGVRGMWPEFCMTNGGQRGYQIHPPIPGFPEAMETFWWAPERGYCTRAGCCMAAREGYRRYPGAGASPTVLFAGCNGICGDMGRMGMVCVTYC